jgi:hypothetical protein
METAAGFFATEPADDFCVLGTLGALGGTVVAVLGAAGVLREMVDAALDEEFPFPFAATTLNE